MEKCTQCGVPADNGEGWNGLCGNCADRQEMIEGLKRDIQKMRLALHYIDEVAPSAGSLKDLDDADRETLDVTVGWIRECRSCIKGSPKNEIEDSIK